MATIYINIVNLDIDFDALEMSEKGFIIGFMAFLLLTNAIMVIVKFTRHRLQICSRAKDAVHLALSVAGVGLGLFPNVVLSVMLFQQHHSYRMTCMPVYLAQCYIYKFMPVAYGCGLILLALDVVKRSKTTFKTKTRQSSAYNCAFFVFPLMAALVITCPLTLIDVDWDNGCGIHSKTQFHAAVIVCSFVPAALVLTSSLIARLYKTGSGEMPDAFDSPMYDDVTNEHDDENMERKITVKVKNIYVLDSGKQISTFPIPTDENNSDLLDEDVRMRSQNIRNHSCTLRKEKTVLFLAAVIFLVTEIPFNVLSFYITEAYNDERPFVYEVETSVFILFSAFNWIKYIYPVVLPILWLTV